MDPAEKYRDRVELNHKMAMDAVAFADQLLEPQAVHIASERMGLVADILLASGWTVSNEYQDVSAVQVFWAQNLPLATASRLAELREQAA